MQSEIRKNLEKHGVRPSLQRLAVMEYLRTHRTHPTVDEIYEALSPQIPTLSRTTVYNTLNRLVEQGAILVIDIDKGNRRYDGFTEFHAHFLCDRCGVLEDIAVEDSHFVGQHTPPGAQIRDVQLLYKGVCAGCRQKESKNIA